MPAAWEGAAPVLLEEMGCVDGSEGGKKREDMDMAEATWIGSQARISGGPRGSSSRLSSFLQTAN